MTRNGEPILSTEMMDELHVNIAVEGPYNLLGLVTSYEEHSTRVEHHYTIQEWYDLSPEERASEIALRRINQAIEYHRAKAEQREMNKKKH